MTARQTATVVALCAFLQGVGFAVVVSYYFEFTPLYGAYLVWCAQHNESKENLRFVEGRPQQSDSPRKLEVCIRFRGPTIGSPCPKKM